MAIQHVSLTDSYKLIHKSLYFVCISGTLYDLLWEDDQPL